MASLGVVRCGGNYARPSDLRHVIFPRHNSIAPRPHPPPQPQPQPRPRQYCCLPTSTSCKPNILVSQTNLQPSRESRNSQDRIEEWMRESVTEIVKKLPDSPLLVQVYSDRSGKAATMMENAEEGEWELVKEKWEKGEMPMPDGVIFVEKIEDGSGGDESEEISKAWGIVVQGREAQAQACYLLKTNRVGSGMGLWCTHFCLVRVKSFRETAGSQLKNCWLLQAQSNSDLRFH